MLLCVELYIRVTEPLIVPLCESLTMHEIWVRETCVSRRVSGEKGEELTGRHENC